jgi:acetyl-CoA synthetase
VGRPDEIKGEEVYAFVTLEGHYEASPELAKALKDHVVKEIGIIARPGEMCCQKRDRVKLCVVSCEL